MKVYILRENNSQFAEIIDVFDSLEQAQSYKDGLPENWKADPYANGWWDRTIITVDNLNNTEKRMYSIIEWEVKTRPLVFNQDEANNRYCVACKHTISDHGRYGCNYDHDKPLSLFIYTTQGSLVESNHYI